ncbi:hypothetical protein, partial [Borreliella valaisiana]|uniref:hypothetical protein n=1 Tax=Borreliella valaisiana TaxID=62088 RepID=UPI001B346BBC
TFKSNKIKYQNKIISIYINFTSNLSRIINISQTKKVLIVLKIWARITVVSEKAIFKRTQTLF